MIKNSNRVLQNVPLEVVQKVNVQFSPGLHGPWNKFDRPVLHIRQAHFHAHYYLKNIKAGFNIEIVKTRHPFFLASFSLEVEHEGNVKPCLLTR